MNNLALDKKQYSTETYDSVLSRDENLKPYFDTEDSQSNPDYDNVVSYRDIQKLRHRNISVKSESIRNQEPSFNTVSLWEGEIIEIDNESSTFLARIIDSKHRNEISDNIEDYMEFSFDEIDQSELKYVAVGALFCWHIGYEYTAKGQLKNTSFVVFRDMPVWGNKKDEAAEKAIYFSKLIQGISS